MSCRRWHGSGVIFPRCLCIQHCKHIFIDLGANRGVHGRFLFEPGFYRNARLMHEIFNRTYGTNRSNYMTYGFAFEPNPAHHQRLDTLQKVYNKFKWPYFVFLFGVSDYFGKATFHTNFEPDANGTERHHFWGFSTSLKRPQYSRAIELRVVEFPTWLGRLLSCFLHPSKGIMNRKIEMKMDIVGQELCIIP